jgi:hypothetical protein
VLHAYTSHGSAAAALGRQQKPASLDESGREFCVFVDVEAPVVASKARISQAPMSVPTRQIGFIGSLA